ncbi:hypothetical protein NDU88_007243 [Pleurodeles waltl]|uniref:Uncharacterized protein n=1 Tax=Pleurodeles waltl TaxID=8319 RepID=A0AAV7RNV8_PLEWA|nr:hypothetical protein NDU88_007243 [Pleurodeles waltl]
MLCPCKSRRTAEYGRRSTREMRFKEGTAECRKRLEWKAASAWETRCWNIREWKIVERINMSKVCFAILVISAYIP